MAGLLLLDLSATKNWARTTRCTANFCQFALALPLYAQDHDDQLPPNADGREEALGAKWVEGWLGLPGPDCTNTLHLRRSLLAPYLGEEVRIWQCPAARPVTVAGITQPRVRTLSLNCFRTRAAGSTGWRTTWPSTTSRSRKLGTCTGGNNPSAAVEKNHPRGNPEFPAARVGELRCRLSVPLCAFDLPAWAPRQIEQVPLPVRSEAGTSTAARPPWTCSI